MQSFEYWRASADGLKLLTRLWEPTEAPRAVVCLVHGLGEHSGRYGTVAEALVREGYALLAFDLRGHGRSEGRRGHAPSIDVLLDDVDRLLAEAGERFPGLPCFLYGHSLGATLVLNHALRRRPPIAGVIATGAWLRLAFAPPAWKLMLGRVTDRLWPTFSLPAGLDVQSLCRDARVVRAYQGDPLVHDRVSARLAIGTMQAGKFALDYAADFPVPLLLMHGGADRIASAAASRRFAARAPAGCTFWLWEGLYHEIHNEPEGAEVLRLLVSWLAEACPAGGVGATRDIGSPAGPAVLSTSHPDRPAGDPS